MAGQAMVLGLVTILVLCVGVILLFDSGQTLNRKVQLTNAADAAAYSVAVQQARAWNFAAYMNRGRVANEIAVAQVVSLYSWMNMMHMTSITMRTTMDVLSAIPYVGVVFKILGTVFKAIETGAKVARKAYQPLGKVMVQALDALNGAFAAAATAVIEAISRVDGFRIAGDVVVANAPGAQVATLGKGILAGQLLKAESDYLDSFRIPRNAGSGSTANRNGANRYRNVVMQSRDEFSSDRGEEVNLGIIRFTAAGGTDMVEYNRWAAMDTMGLHVGLPFPLDDVDLPLGWGGAQAVERYQNQRFLQGFDSGRGWYSDYDRRRYRPYGNTLRTNRIATNLASSDPNVTANGGRARDAYFTGYNGLRNYHDVKRGKAADPNATDAGPVFTVYADTALSTARTSSTIDGIGGPAGSPMAMQDRAPRGRMAALASAQVYFNRPFAYNPFKRKDGRLETGNLFSPYWQARLVDTPEAIRRSVQAFELAGT